MPFMHIFFRMMIYQDKKKGKKMIFLPNKRKRMYSKWRFQLKTINGSPNKNKTAGICRLL